MTATHQRPDLLPPVLLLLETLVPAVRDGGAVSLSALVVALAGDRVKPGVRRELEARGDLRFERAAGGATFRNDGPNLSIELKRFTVVVPARIAGRAALTGDGAELRFDRDAALGARKLLVTVRFQAIEVTGKRVLVSMETHAFDQCYELT